MFINLFPYGTTISNGDPTV